MATAIYDLHAMREKLGFHHVDLRDHDEVLPPFGMLFEQGVFKFVRSLQSWYSCAEGCCHSSSECAVSSYKCGHNACRTLQEKPITEFFEHNDSSINIERHLHRRIPIWVSFFPQLKDRELLQAHFIETIVTHFEAQNSEVDCTCALIKVVESVAPELLRKDVLGRTAVVDACCRIADDIRSSDSCSSRDLGMQTKGSLSLSEESHKCNVGDSPTIGKASRKARAATHTQGTHKASIPKTSTETVTDRPATEDLLKNFVIEAATETAAPMDTPGTHEASILKTPTEFEPFQAFWALEWFNADTVASTDTQGTCKASILKKPKRTGTVADRGPPIFHKAIIKTPTEAVTERGPATNLAQVRKGSTVQFGDTEWV
eukprot:gnl/MRDRNA2_/MRDRNA2_112913_c0_seq1.p1 gnl/MRDRNA2_/MRDRNA2_112913_c0~~gnl/MRDRNA2_/MRDRNA2_112913_c0_seq1.p1  ORF type:complete len:373 (+),score=58.46 gnl/MRDRNA2_/MRDRNA2_112913_c0_seq1:86-1204(+)